MTAHHFIRKSLSRVVVAFSIVGLMLPAVAWATGSTQFVDPNPEAGDQFGYALSISTDGNIAVVGSPNSTVNGNSLQGTSYIFVNSGGSWTEAAQLAPSDGNSYDRFGTSVSVTPDGSKVIVGALYSPPSDMTSMQTGNAYIFNEPAGGWSNGSVQQVSQAAELAGSDSANGDFFGSSVALSADGSTAIVGAKQHGTGQSQGEAYIFTQPVDGWVGKPVETSILAASDGAVQEFFGWSVALSADGSTAFVGAPGGGSANTLPGSVYEFSEPAGGWTAGPPLMANGQSSQDGAAGDLFGLSVDVTADGTTAIVGAPDHTVGANQFEGTAYILSNTGGSLSQATELTAPDGVAGDKAGYSVAIASDGTSALVGAPARTVNANSNEGAAYQYNMNSGNWVMNNELTPTDGANQNFGWSTFIISDQAEGNAFVGAPALSSGTGSAAPASRNLSAAASGIGGGNGTAYQINLAPSISTLNPASGRVGASVTINGSNFNGATQVSFNGTPAAILTNSGSQITAKVPVGASSGPVSVTTPNGNGSSTTDFTVIPPPAPTITSFTPTSQKEGGNVTIKGKNLAGAQVSLNGQSLHIVKINSTATAVTVTLPLNAVSGYFVVVTAGGSIQSASQITVLGPTISSIPLSAKVGGIVTIKGANLAGVTNVVFNGGVSATPFSATNGAVKVLVPAGATSGPVTVSAPSGQATSTASLTIKP
jgi:hypothetical protein